MIELDDVALERLAVWACEMAGPLWGQITEAAREGWRHQVRALIAIAPSLPQFKDGDLAEILIAPSTKWELARFDGSVWTVAGRGSLSFFPDRLSAPPRRMMAVPYDSVVLSPNDPVTGYPWDPDWLECQARRLTSETAARRYRAIAEAVRASRA